MDQTAAAVDAGGSELPSRAEVLPTLLPKACARVALALKVLNRVLQWHAVVLKESIEFIARGNIKKPAELMAGEAPHPVRIDRQGCERGLRQILTVISQLRDDIVRKIQPDAHASQYTA
jgi:hypothetical protein